MAGRTPSSFQPAAKLPVSSPKSCHPERSEGPMQHVAAASKEVSTTTLRPHRTINNQKSTIKNLKSEIKNRHAPTATPPPSPDSKPQTTTRLPPHQSASKSVSPLRAPPSSPPESAPEPSPPDPPAS